MIQVVDSFCGAGGLSLGLIRSGLEVVYAFDSDIDSIKTYRKNIGDHACNAEVHNVSAQTIADHLGGALNSDHLVLVGGPPCQGFSVQRRGDNSDIRNHLTLEFLRLVLELRPKLFLMENVGGLLSPRGAPFIKQFKDTCDGNGYFIHTKKLNAVEFGLPQNRKRVFLVGELMENSFVNYTFPDPNNSWDYTESTVRDTIYDLVEMGWETLPNHIWDKLSPKNKERIQSVRPGQGRDSLPEHLRLPVQDRNPSHRHLDTYGRMLWDEPSPTITARFDSFSRGKFGHPELDRTISLREGARLQTFPDDFEFEGRKGSVARQIGNAVPPRMAQHIGDSITKFFGMF